MKIYRLTVIDRVAHPGSRIEAYFERAQDAEATIKTTYSKVGDPKPIYTIDTIDVLSAPTHL